MTRAPRAGRALQLLVVGLVATIGLAGCGYKTVQDVPLPGGASLGDEPYSVTVMLANVVDLVPNNSVRVNDVPVGVVREIALATGSRIPCTEALLGLTRLTARVHGTYPW